MVKRNQVALHKKIWAWVYVVVIALLMYAPILVLILYSFTDSSNVGIWNGFTFSMYAKLFRNKEIMRVVANTLIVAVVSSIIATILGTLGAIGTFNAKARSRKAIEGMTQIPIINAEIVMAMSLVVLFVILGGVFNFLTLVVGHVVLTVAFVYLSVKPRLVQMDSSLYEAALDLGAQPSYALRKVILPEILPGILSGFMLSFTLSLDDYIFTAYLKPGSFDTLSTYVQGVIAKHPLPPELRALTTIIFIFALLILLVNNLRARREAKFQKFHHRKGSK